MVQEIIKGGFTYTVAGKSLTIAAKGVTKARFKKVGALGDYVTLDLTGWTKTFDFDTTFNLAGCGITETVNWANAMPWFDFLINVTNAAAGVELGTSRNPCATVTPAAANIHYNNAVSATEAQTNFMVARSNAVDCAAAPVIAIGSHTMTYATADDDWTPGAIASTDGFGRFQEGVQFTFPTGQNGGTTGSTLSEAGAATSLAFASEVSTYVMNRDGSFAWNYSTGTRSAGDASGTALYVHLPLAAVAGDLQIGTAHIKVNNTIGTYYMRVDGANSYVTVRNSAGVLQTVDAWVNANDTFYGLKLVIRAF